MLTHQPAGIAAQAFPLGTETFANRTNDNAMRKQTIKRIEHPDRILSYFKAERGLLTLVTVTGLFYNAGMIAGPIFEGKLAQCLLDIMQGKAAFSDMLRLAILYLIAIFAVQAARALKRFEVRHFANSTSRNMRHTLYNSLVHMSHRELESESLGSLMTKAISDVDACAEGMRKFTTEIFDTGVVLIVYLVMLCSYDWRLTILACIFPPFAYLFASRLKVIVTKSSAAYKKSAGALNTATMDRVGNAITYRVYGRETNRDAAYEQHLNDYEKKAVAANIWESSMQPLYNIIAMCGAVMILYFGSRNVLGYGWTVWNVGAFTTFLSCFTKLATKSSKAAKLFNAVQKASVSWKRVKPLMKEPVRDDLTLLDLSPTPVTLRAENICVSWPASHPGKNAHTVLKDLSFTVKPGEILGVTGPVACGKSSLGKALIREADFSGSLTLTEKSGTPDETVRDFRSLTNIERSTFISYMGHEPELLSTTIAENIKLGKEENIDPYLAAVCFDEEVAQMPEGKETPVGNGGVRLSGGQQARVALARTLFHGRSVLILDDPFSAVDRTTEARILKNLRLFAQDRAVILISHRLYQFPDFDHVLFLDEGTGIFSTHKDLMTENPAYAQLYREQTEGTGTDLDDTEEQSDGKEAER